MPSNITPQALWEGCFNQTQHREELFFVGLYVLIFVAGLTLNLIAVVVFFCHTKTRSHTTVYMTNLALADLFMVCTLPVRICYHLDINLPQSLCDLMGMALLINMYGSIFLLSCTSLDRCVAVCFPMSPRVRQVRKKAPFICLGVWVLTVGASLPIYLTKSQTDKQNQTQCFGTFPIYATRAIAVNSSLTVGFGVPLTVMLISSWGFIRAIRQSQVAQTELVDGRKIQRMITMCLVIFVCCFVPYHLTLLLLYWHQDYIPCSLVTSYRYSLMVACLNAVLDPLAYYFTTETFRRQVDLDALRQVWPMQGQSSDKNNSSKGALNT